MSTCSPDCKEASTRLGSAWVTTALFTATNARPRWHFMIASMAEAVRLAASRALPGEVVLLSPACASFDMFKNYGHRGAEFRRLVEALAESSDQGGEVIQP